MLSVLDVTVQAQISVIVVQLILIETPTTIVYVMKDG